MFCCLEFSFAVYYKFITIDMDRNSIKIDLKSALSKREKNGIVDRLLEEPLDPCSINPDYIEIMFCPWCGLHLNHAVDLISVQEQDRTVQQQRKLGAMERYLRLFF
jgi:hypothetical protein